MYSTLEDVEFLSRSTSRVQVLDAIAEEPRTRYELRELTGASRVTVNRIVADLEDRGWIDHERGRCEATPQGRYVAREFARLLGNLDVAEDLDGALSWLPTDEFGFELEALADAAVLRTTDWEDHTATIRQIADRVSRTDRIRGTAIGFSHEVVDAIREETADGTLTFEAAIDEPTLGMIREDSGLRERFADILATDNGRLDIYRGEDPLHMVMCFDETVTVCGHVEGGPPPGTVQTDRSPVRSWAEDYYESVLAESERVGADAFAPEQSSHS